MRPEISPITNDFLPKIRVFVNTSEYSDSCGVGLLEFGQKDEENQFQFIKDIKVINLFSKNMFVCVKLTLTENQTTYEKSNCEVYSSFLNSNKILDKRGILAYDLFQGVKFSYNLDRELIR